MASPARSRSTRCAAALCVFLAGCPFAMNEDYTLATQSPVPLPTDDAGASAAPAPPPPSMPPPDDEHCPMGKMEKDCKPDAGCMGKGC